LYSGSLTGDPFVGLNYLEFLDMSGNDFNSSVPLAVSTLPNLKRLHIEGAFLTGSLFFLTNMNMISEVSLDFNNIQGRIPSKIGLLQNLVSVSMSNNELTGRIPSEIGALSLLGKWVFCEWGYGVLG
jgi:Leucine-rich repeat (LRR) protein